MNINTNSNFAPVQDTTSRLQNQQEADRTIEFLDEILQEQAARMESFSEFPITQLNDDIVRRQEEVLKNYRKMATDRRWLGGREKLQIFECPSLERLIGKSLKKLTWYGLFLLVLVAAILYLLQLGVSYWHTQAVQIETMKLTFRQTASCSGMIIGCVCAGILVRYLILALVLRSTSSIYVNQDHIPLTLNCIIELCTSIVVTLVMWWALASKPYLLQDEKRGVSLLKAMNIVFVTKLPILFNFSLSISIRYLIMAKLGMFPERDDGDDEAQAGMNQAGPVRDNEADREGIVGAAGVEPNNDVDAEDRIEDGHHGEGERGTDEGLIDATGTGPTTDAYVDGEDRSRGIEARDSHDDEGEDGSREEDDEV